MYISPRQLQLLRNLIIYLKCHNDYYGDLLREYGFFDYEHIEEVYRDLPILTKQEIIDNPEHYYDRMFIDDLSLNNIDINEISIIDNLSQNHDKIITTANNSWFIETTSGTTGRPLPVVKCLSERLIESKHLNKCRHEIDPSCTLKNGFLLVHKTDEFLKKLDIRGNNQNDLERAYEYMLKINPKWIFSTTLLFKQFVQYIFEKRDCQQRINLSFVETTSQKLYLEDKLNANKVFNCKFVNNYGCREVWNIAYSCKYGELHVNTSNLIVDLVDDNGLIINEENVEGNIIISSLSSKTTPFIKYAIGDRGKLLNKACPCGNLASTLMLVDGRTNEKLMGTSYYGNVIFRKVLRTLNFHDKINDIKFIKIIQEDQNKLIIYVEKEKSYDSYFEECFINNFALQIGDCKKFKFRFIYSFPFSKKQDKESIFTNKIGAL